MRLKVHFSKWMGMKWQQYIEQKHRENNLNNSNLRERSEFVTKLEV